MVGPRGLPRSVGHTRCAPSRRSYGMGTVYGGAGVTARSADLYEAPIVEMLAAARTQSKEAGPRRSPPLAASIGR